MALELVQIPVLFPQTELSVSVLQDVGRSLNDESDESDDSDSDNFSVEFEVESIDSDAYSENDEDSIPGEDEVLTLFCEAAALV